MPREIKNGAVETPETRIKPRIFLSGVSEASDKRFDETENEDSYLLFKIKGYFVAAVLDGVGGEEKGAEASVLAKKLILEKLKKILADETASDDLEEKMEKAFEEINDQIIKECGIGSTTVGLAIVRQLSDDKFELLAVNHGDSRLELIKTEEHGLQHITLDDCPALKKLAGNLGLTSQFEAQQWIARLTPSDYEKLEADKKEAVDRFFEKRNEISAGLGYPSLSQSGINLLRHTVTGSARLILASDGLWDTLSDPEIEKIIKRHKLPKYASIELLKAVRKKVRAKAKAKRDGTLQKNLDNLRAKDDDITIIVIDIGDIFSLFPDI